MTANAWRVSDECRAALAALLSRHVEPPADARAARSLADAVVAAVEQDFARAVAASFERWRRPSAN